MIKMCKVQQACLLIATFGIVQPVLAQTCVTASGEHSLDGIQLNAPDVFVESNGYAYLTGTAEGTKHIKIYESESDTGPDGGFDPNPVVSRNIGDEYCQVWAADLSKRNDLYRLTFTAKRKHNGACPKSTDDVATGYIITANSISGLSTATIEPYYPGGDYDSPGTRALGIDYTSFPDLLPNSCQKRGDPNCVRLDLSLASYGNDWNSYKFPSGSNNEHCIASSNTNNLTQVTTHSCSSKRYEGGNNEAPDMIKVSGNHYVLYSVGRMQDFHGYRLAYEMGSQMKSVLRDNSTVSPVVTFPGYNENGIATTQRAHGSIVSWNGENYLFYTKWDKDSDGRVTACGAHWAVLGFDIETGEIVPFYDWLSEEAIDAKRYSAGKDAHGDDLCADNQASLDPGIVDLHRCQNNVRAQRWDIIRMPYSSVPDYVMLRVVKSGLCMTIEDGSDGTKVWQQNCMGSNGQLFMIESVGGDEVKLKTKISNDTKCVVVSGLIAGRDLKQGSCTPSSSNYPVWTKM